MNRAVPEPTDTPRFRLMVPQDIPCGLELCRLAGWNQTAGDWQRLIDHHAAGCFVAECDNRVVASVTTTPYGEKLGWIGMMLVHPEYRRRGIARAAMQQAITSLRRFGVACIKLDATPAGLPLYRSLGFQVEYSFHRWQRGDLGSPGRSDASPGGGLLCEAMKQLDRRVFGADRTTLLDRLAADSTVIQERDGYGMRRAGTRAPLIGPVVARNVEAANRIVMQLIDAPDEPLIWDVPEQNGAAMRLAEQFGFAPTRPLSRMWLGEPRATEWHAWQYAYADPGTG